MELSNPASALSERWLTDAVRARNEDADTVDSVAAIGSHSVAAVSGEHSRVQLWTPGGSARRVYVDAVWIGVVSATPVRMKLEDTQHGSLVGAPIYKRETGDLPHVLPQGDTVATLPTFEFFSTQLNNNQSMRVGFNRPVSFINGWGLTVYTVATNIALDVTFEWREFLL